MINRYYFFYFKNVYVFNAGESYCMRVLVGLRPALRSAANVARLSERTMRKI
jgi:hypothetical protein